MPVYQDRMPVHQDLMPVCQDFMPDPQYLPIVKDVYAASDTISKVYKSLISKGLIYFLHDTVNNRKIKILRDTDASQFLLLADVLR